MKKEPNFLLSPTLGNLYVFSNNLSRLLSILLCYNDQDKRKKYGVIEDSNKKAERSYSPSNVLPVYLFFNSDTEKVVKKE